MKVIVFGILCFVVGLLPLLPYMRRTKMAWLASAAPLLLILICAAVFYVKISPPFFQTADGAGTLGKSIVDLANKVAGRMVGVVTRRISVDIGAYLALLASVVIAIRGWMQFRSTGTAKPLSVQSA